MTAAAFRKVELSDADPSSVDVSLYLNKGKTAVTSTVLDYFTVSGAVSSRVAEFGLTTGAGNTANWTGLADVRLMYYGSEAMEMNETDRSFDIPDGTYGNATVTQNLVADSWNLICLPFDLSSTQIRSCFKDVKALKSAVIEGDVCRLMFEDVREMKAGVPYLVGFAQPVSLQTYEKVTVNDKAISEGAVTLAAGSATIRLAGTPVRTALNGAGCYVYAKDALLKVDDGTEINGFRAYLEVEGATLSQINLYVDNELLTSVRGAGISNASDSDDVQVYISDGKLIRRDVKRGEALRGLPSGVYIVDGKKMLK
ncbi:MAG: hypothetical protein LUC45_03920 [Paraprevotella sp.]|nr:hypothetical protein [Paraprevotella sp.]